VIVVSYFDPW